MEIDVLCPDCETLNTATVTFPAPVASCSQCNTSLLSEGSDRFKNKGTLDQCPCCGAEHLYRQRDFNRALGISLVVIGALLAPFTYGISLIVLALVDFIIYRSVSEIACCYRCGGVYRATPEIARIEPFNLQIYDYYRNLKNA